MPAEWEKHTGTLLIWPSNRETWPGEKLKKAELVYLDIIRSLIKFEPIVLLVESGKMRSSVEKKFKESEISTENIFIKEYPVNDVWARDCGPIFVKEGENFRITNWEYNAWGEKYPPWGSDNKIPGFIAEAFNVEKYDTGMVLEGGSIEVNGSGDLITTESVLLNPNRNPEMTRKEIEDKLQEFLGVQNVIWLKSGLAGDDTDGHIDDLTRFLNENTVLTMICEDEPDVNYATLRENFEILKSSELKNGKSLNIEVLNLPKTKIQDSTVDGSEYVPASYANFYIANDCVLVPVYNDPNDEKALKLIQKYFPERQIIGINCTDLVWGQGSIHCITQQLYGIDLPI